MNTDALEIAVAQNEIKQPAVVAELYEKFGESLFTAQYTADDIPTFWVGKAHSYGVLNYLRKNISEPYLLLYDLTAIDERQRTHRSGQPASDFTVLYHLISPARNDDIRIKVALQEGALELTTASTLWRSANWYEREVWDMFGIVFEGHPNLHRILLPPTWKGHPLRKEHPCRATEMEDFNLTDEWVDEEQNALRFDPEKWGIKTDTGKDTDYMYLNLGPNHPSAHGAFRVMMQLEGEEIINSVAEIGFHHRGAEKIGERQSWHSYIPYTDRVDYVAGVMNNLPYVLSLEKMAGIEVPERAKVIRVMLCELSRIMSHLLFYGTFAQDLGQMSPVLYMFIDREKAYKIMEAITGGRQHPSWFRIGGVAQDLPKGWDKMVAEFVEYLPKRLDHYDKMVMKNSIVKQRSKGLGSFTTGDAWDWAATGPMLRATGSNWDLRKKRPYAGYDAFDFEVAEGINGDIYDRCAVRVEEMRQSIRIIKQCLDNMPEGPYKADHRLTTPPPKERAMQDIETLIQHFTTVTWGPVIPPGECVVPIEATKGMNGYYLVSDGSTSSYRTRIRTPSFAHLQMIPFMSNGLMVADLIAIIASIDFVMADVDR